ncbi:MAG TPA: Fic family protein [Proteobacteria bacterium]|nr:Fic family protein [Pseudomonadota bacterium]
MVQYIWQSDSWPEFHWESAALLRPLGMTRQSQGELIAKSGYFELEIQAEVLIEEAITTAAIEGEVLNRDSVCSSVARRLGLPTAGLSVAERSVDGLVEMLIDATRYHEKPLTASRLKGWQAALFPTGYSGMRHIVVGDWRRGKEPMQVVSGPMGKETVHYEAPPSKLVNGEVKSFLTWFRSSPEELDGLIRAAIAHLKFVTIHPFEDGNGRIARAIADMALAQDYNMDYRLYSMSAQIREDRDDYYDLLERTQKGDGEITEWIVWFLGCLKRAIQHSDSEIRKVMEKARLWEKIAHLGLNDRQRKVVNRLLEAGPGSFEGGMTNRKYRGMTKATRETAKRDISDLVTKGILVKRPGGGRSSSYDLGRTIDSELG